MSTKKLTAYPTYPVGQKGKPWGPAEKKQWLSRQTKQRDYFTAIVSPLMRITHGDILQYGELDYREFGGAKYPLFAIRSKNFSPDKKLVVFTGGNHGYEESGALGALAFAQRHLTMTDKFNFLVLPCMSAWGFEYNQRWNPYAVDPNRQYHKGDAETCPEAVQAMACIEEHVKMCKNAGILIHVDLHETTDTDNSEFTPAKIARDGKIAEEEQFSEIPDGYYSVASTHSAEPEYQKYVVEQVAKVTHIAPADEKGNIIGEPSTEKGIIFIEGRKWGICGSHTDAKYALTTEIYPDSEKTNPAECVEAQVVCCKASVEYALRQEKA